MRGAWIEIKSDKRELIDALSSLPVRGAWIEMQGVSRHNRQLVSLPVRGAWIEINLCAGDGFLLHVAPRAGSVD